MWLVRRGWCSEVRHSGMHGVVSHSLSTPLPSNTVPGTLGRELGASTALAFSELEHGNDCRGHGKNPPVPSYAVYLANHSVCLAQSGASVALLL
jgi:hypothetical protein